MSKPIGILGGMGPAATVDLFDRIVRATPARRDQDHLRVLIDNNPSIPDRSDAILHGGPDPLPALRAAAQRLVQMGAGLIVIPCNTAHYYWADLQNSVDVPVLNMIVETARAVQPKAAQAEQVGILATAGTLCVGLYQRALAAEGLKPMVPNAAEIDRLTEAIYGSQGIKAGFESGLPQELLCGVGQALIDRGAQALILGCTEIPLVMGDGDLPVPLLASNQVLAEAAVRAARQETVLVK